MRRSVRAGSGPHRPPADPGGHERSRRARRKRGHQAYTHKTSGTAAERERVRIPPPQPWSIQLTALERAASAFRQSCHVGQDSHRRLGVVCTSRTLGYHHAGDQGQPVYTGDVPGPEPARAPPSKAVAGGAHLSGAAGGGLPCLGRVRDAERRCPRERGVPGPRLVHIPSEPSGSQRSLAVHHWPRWQGDPKGIGPGAEP